MLLIVANYAQEVSPGIKKFENVQVEILNENKGRNFAFKLQKLILKHKPNKVLHL